MIDFERAKDYFGEVAYHTQASLWLLPDGTWIFTYDHSEVAFLGERGIMIDFVLGGAVSVYSGGGYAFFRMPEMITTYQKQAIQEAFEGIQTCTVWVYSDQYDTKKYEFDGAIGRLFVTDPIAYRVYQNELWEASHAQD